MCFPLFVMDTSFYHSLGTYPFDARCEMLKELGCDATYLTLWSELSWQDVPRLKDVKAKHDLDVAGVYVLYDFAKPVEDPELARIRHLLDSAEGFSNFEMSIKSSDEAIQKSDPTHDDEILSRLEPLLKIAERRGITISLYPHTFYWLERMEDAVRLCKKMNHPNLRMVFCGLHWYAVDPTQLPTRLQEAAPYLRSANICGTRRKTGRFQATVETLDEGELDNFAVLGLLKKLGYQGMVGIQGYSVGGDVYTKLKRSIQVYRDMQLRLIQHPNWAEMRER